jgi:hypothetical protein
MENEQRPEIPEMRVGMVDGTWTVAIADMAGWVQAGTWTDLSDEAVADWIEVHEAVDTTQFQEELYNRAVAAENALARMLPPNCETRTDWGFEITSEGVTSVCRSVTEEAARGELKFFEKLDPRVMQRTVITGSWIEAA